MIILDSIVKSLRDLAKQQKDVPFLLRWLINELKIGDFPTIELIKYFKEAFFLNLKDVSPIGGWLPNGKGYLSDEKINGYILGKILDKKNDWDKEK